MSSQKLVNCITSLRLLSQPERWERSSAAFGQDIRLGYRLIELRAASCTITAKGKSHNLKFGTKGRPFQANAMGLPGKKVDSDFVDQIRSFRKYLVRRVGQNAILTAFYLLMHFQPML